MGVFEHVVEMSRRMLAEGYEPPPHAIFVKDGEPLGTVVLPFIDSPPDKEVLRILVEATTSAFEEGLEEGAIGNLCSLLEAMAELYDPDTLLQKIAEGVEKYREGIYIKRIQITSEALSNLISEIADALGIPEPKVKRALLSTLL